MNAAKNNRHNKTKPQSTDTVTESQIYTAQHPSSIQFITLPKAKDSLMNWNTKNNNNKNGFKTLLNLVVTAIKIALHWIITWIFLVFLLFLGGECVWECGGNELNGTEWMHLAIFLLLWNEKMTFDIWSLDCCYQFLVLFFCSVRKIWWYKRLSVLCTSVCDRRSNRWDCEPNVLVDT